MNTFIFRNNKRKRRFYIFMIILLAFNVLRIFIYRGKGLNDDYTLVHVPKGYELSNSISNERTFGETIIHDYQNDEGSIITIQITIYEDMWDSEIETNGEENCFVHNGQEFYETMNYELNQIYWHEGKSVYILFGDASMDLLRKTIKKNL